jgi:hypothetical protein
LVGSATKGYSFGWFRYQRVFLWLAPLPKGMPLVGSATKGSSPWFPHGSRKTKTPPFVTSLLSQIPSLTQNPRKKIRQSQNMNTIRSKLS